MPTPLFQLTRKMITQAPELAECKDLESKIAIVLLLSHLIPADGKILDCEIEEMVNLASRRFKVDPSIISKFLKISQFNHKTHVPMEDLVKKLKAEIGERGLMILIKDLWTIAVADDELHPREEAMIYHVADQLGISRRDVITAQSAVCR